MEILKSAGIFIAGHRGLVGNAVVRTLKENGFSNLLLQNHSELDLLKSPAVDDYFSSVKPEYVILAAAKVGGIHANNSLRGDFILQNLQIQTNVIGAAFRTGVRRLVFLGSSCIYPKLAPQPIPENALLSGPLEPTNEAYAVAKIAGVILCKSLALQYGCDFISLMPTNIYGPGDNYDLLNCHVLPALIRKFHEAKLNQQSQVVCWGSGQVFREFMYADDLADAILFCLQNYNEIEHVNVGTGQEICIFDLAHIIAEIVGFEGKILWDTSKPDGTPRKLMDSRKLNGMGWKPKYSLQEGIRLTYKDYLQRNTEINQ